MMTDELNEALSRQNEIMPSSGFVSSVMDAVQRDAAAPQPIPFPWLRAIPVFAAFAAVLAMLTTVIVQIIRLPHEIVPTWELPSAFKPILDAATQANAGWIAAALLLALTIALLSMRVAGGRS